MNIEERADKTMALLNEHGDTFVKYTVEDRVFSFTIIEVILMEYGAYSPFEPDMLVDIFKDMKDDTNYEGFERMDVHIMAAVANRRW